MKDKQRLFSLLWIFVTLNYLYCDVLTLMDSNLLKQILSGKVGSITMNEGFLLGAGILMEIPMAMILVSRLVREGLCKWLNVAAALIMTLVQIATLIGPSTMYYKFFSAIEITTTLSILVIALRWKTDSAEAEK